MKLIQTQEQKLQQVQRLSQQQMLQVHLLEMPLTELEQSVNAELDDNPALETTSPEDVFEGCHVEGNDSSTSYGDDSQPSSSSDGASDNDDFDASKEREERDSALNDALERIGGGDDDMPTAGYTGGSGADSADYEEMVYGDTTSFYDKLKEQMGETELSEKDEDIMEYVIGSLDSDGLLRKDSESISDELAIYHGIDCTIDDVDRVVRILQTFDPAGIGAHSLQECLLLQIKRRPNDSLKPMMQKVITDCFDEFTKKHFDKIRSALGVDIDTAERVMTELRRLNPKPGSSLGETEGRNIQQITPDFIVDTDDNGNVTFTLNSGNIPELKVSPSFADMMEAYKNNKTSMSRREKEALLYAKEKVERARGYIEAIKVRRRTLTITMQAIIDWQRRFFQDGDEADLKPMILKNIADRTGLDISTISRVSNIKYAQTNWGTFPLRFFFSDGYTTDEGEELSTRKIKLALKDLIAKEDKKKPMSDDALTKALTKLGYPIARRTVAKYREQLGLPVARLRKG
ncbi:RNA polymerase factor sigma-54 [uncultured Prevotella sp.]|uniref:RNA polymerase factor sigma-54 n=1 Tax=uncultured Prevotella sp. TaxID=159272 RepID=UPI002624B839|nr:RNA polymerase factor sigma-54 [uncultured Prevotella sp.]